MADTGASLTCWGYPTLPPQGIWLLDSIAVVQEGLHPFGPGLSSHSPAEHPLQQNDPSVPQFPHACHNHHIKLGKMRFVTDGNTGLFSFFWDSVPLRAPLGCVCVELKAREGSIWIPAPQTLGAVMEQHRLHAGSETQCHQPAEDSLFFCRWEKLPFLICG